eukprot:gene11207-3262_t
MESLPFLLLFLAGVRLLPLLLVLDLFLDLVLDLVLLFLLLVLLLVLVVVLLLLLVLVVVLLLLLLLLLILAELQNIFREAASILCWGRWRVDWLPTLFWLLDLLCGRRWTATIDPESGFILIVSVAGDCDVAITGQDKDCTHLFDYGRKWLCHSKDITKLNCETIRCKMRRLSKREKLQEQVKSFDVFNKVEPDTGITQQTTSGAIGRTCMAAVTFLTYFIVIILVVSEISEYKTLKIKYDYSVDTDLKRDMNLTLDITVAMDCKYIGADYINLSGGSTDGAKHLTFDAAHFELSPNQLEWVENWTKTKELEGSRGLDSLSRFLHGSTRGPMPTAAPEIDAVPKACRIHGVIPIAKVAGNFHITAGKSVHHIQGHTHFTSLVPTEGKIDRFSFSEESVGAMSLDGDLKKTENVRQMYQYFLEVVPSTTQRLRQENPFRSNQYSVTEQHRILQAMDRRIPGIYFKFDIEALGVHHPPLLPLIVRLIGIVGGIVAASGMLHQCVGVLVNTLSRSSETTIQSQSAAS